MTSHPWTRRGLALAVLVALGAAGPTAARAEQTPETVFRAARLYTVRIRTQITTPFLEDECGSFSGAGFLVDSTRGWVLTNAHVVGHSPSDVTAAFAGGTFHPVRKLYVDPFTDMAVIEVPAADRNHPVAPLDCGEPPEVGETVGAFGHPLGMPFTGTRGIVSGRTDQLLADLLQIDATVDPGNSGGPVIALRDGRIVGIATAQAGDSKTARLNFATPMRDVCRILDLLRAGVAPDPPLLEFSFLVDEDGRRDLRVGATHDATRWPFQPGDRIVSVGREREPVATVSQLVTALRGRPDAVPLQVERAGHEVEIVVHPARRPSVVARRGVILDGALVAPVALDDMSALREPARLVVQSVDPGSVADGLDLATMDILESVDGRHFDDLDGLLAYLNARKSDPPLRCVFRRFGDDTNCWLEYHVRELPGEDIQVIGPGARPPAAAR